MDPVQFIAAGASKSGSEWLLNCLREHPDVFAAPGSIDFFSRHYDRGEHWYNQHFADAGNAKAIGEKSTSYIIYPQVPERIFAWNPKVKFIFVLREPVARSYSHYCMLLRAGEVSSDIREVLIPSNRLVEEGRYFDHLQRFTEYFPKQQMLVRLHEDVITNDAAFLDEVHAFLGVSRDFRPSLLGKKLHVTKSRPRSLRLYQAAKTSLNWISQRGNVGERFANWIRMNGPADTFHKLNRGEDFPKLTHAHKLELLDYYRPDIERLSVFLQRDLSTWINRYDRL